MYNAQFVLLLFLLISPILSTSQDFRQLDPARLTFQSRLDLTRDTVIEKPDLVSSLLNLLVPGSSRVEVKDGSLLLQFQLNARQGDVFLVELESITSDAGGPFIHLAYPPEEISGLGKRLSGRTRADTQTITFHFSADDANLKYLNQEAVFRFTVYRYQKIGKNRKDPCDLPAPKFSLGGKIIHSIPALTGLTFWIIGKSQLDQSEAIYNGSYREQPNKTLAAPLYSEANLLHRRGTQNENIGKGILAAGASWLLFKVIQHEVRKRNYADCPKTTRLQINPYFKWSVPEGPSGAHTGLQLSLHF